VTESPALAELGWSVDWQARFGPYAEQALTPARVIRSDRGSSLVATPAGIVRAKPSVRLLKAARGPADLPAVGDWTALRTAADREVAQIEAVLERGNAITRGDPGKASDLQVLAANIDTVFVVHPIAEGPNLRRIERELAMAWESGATPVVVLTKVDMSADPEASRAAVEGVALGVDVRAVNALDGESAARLLPYISGHRTAVLFGPSGAGKSTLINALLGEARQATREVRVSDGRGRHTTVARELIRIGGHGHIIDTPGLRALGMTGSEEGIATAFADIEDLAGSCRFRDCSHQNEPDCAVRAAVETGALPPERLASYHKLVREARHSAAKSDARLRSEEERKRKVLSKTIKRYYKRTGRG
jgi:ribosome biogenesis GTPase